MGKRRSTKDEAARECRVCKRTLPPRLFNVGPTRADGTAYRKRTCRPCEEAARRAKGIPERHRRYNARGEVWCNHCKRYRSREDFKPHPSREGQFWSYCRDCTREIDRMRWRGERRERTNRQRLVRQRKQQAARRTERIDLVANAIATLLRRGLTKSEICRLAGVTLTSLLAWERKERRVTTNVTGRFVLVLRETAHLPLGEPRPRHDRWHPHPELPALVERIAPKLVAFPLRSRWRGKDAA
jgi:hypothetical protein